MERLEEIRKTLKASEKEPFTMVPYKDDVTYLLSLIDRYKELTKDTKNELNKIYSLANGLNANDMVIRQKAYEAVGIIVEFEKE